MEFKGTKREGANWIININNPAQVLIENVCIIDEPWHLEAVKADALLISKAPEMLELLQDIYSTFEKDGHLLNVDVSSIKQLIEDSIKII